MNYAILYNNQTIGLSEIPETSYRVFFDTNVDLLSDNVERHCVNYFGFKTGDKIKLYCCIADDESHQIYISSCLVHSFENLNSFISRFLSFEKFEREIHVNFGVSFKGHPWLKPVRYSFNRFDKTKTIANYPFFSIESEEMHEVGVGTIHAGVIEPGHFRFICNGEQILHLEIQLGYQHRGIEQLFIDKKTLVQCTTLAESIAGDTVVSHTTAFAQVWESMCGFVPSRDI